MSGKSSNIKRGHVFFNPEDPIYKTHFPLNPVIPGSLIIKAFLEITKSAGTLKRFNKIKDFRFREFISPGLYEYHIKDKTDRIECFLYNNKKKIATGSIIK